MKSTVPGFTPKELRKLRSLKDPHGVQKFLDAMPYHLADTSWSPRRVLQENTSHCFEGAMLAAAALRANGYPPLVMDLEAERDTDHVVAIYRIKGHWGAVAKSNYTGCRYREPVYRTLRELALSYFDVYFNLLGERTLYRDLLRKLSEHRDDLVYRNVRARMSAKGVLAKGALERIVCPGTL